MKNKICKKGHFIASKDITGKKMGYFDDFQLLNVTKVRMYGASEISSIYTMCHYIGVIQGTVRINGVEEKRPFVYLTSRNIKTLSGWISPPNAFRDNFYIECAGERADRFFKAFEAMGRWRYIFVRDITPFVAKLEEFRQLFSLGNPLHHHRMILAFEEFAAMLEAELHHENHPASHRFKLDELLTAINRNPGKKWDFAAEAQRAGVTMRHWRRIFAGSTGMPPNRFVNFCRMRLAKELLTSGNLSIKEIAEKCGFEGASEFSRFFRKNSSLTPGEYRRSRMG